MEKSFNEIVKDLADKSQWAVDSDNALKYSRAALNIAQAAATLDCMIPQDNDEILTADALGILASGYNPDGTIRVGETEYKLSDEWDRFDD